ncbi:MAG: contractile injection system tape measure protein, partial [Cellvibrio sp.]|uniref:contractile injection system tape measure protein n=1 Tax=Cellvibrio sp. TaxID=1965322 RepID=UPI002727525E|nr:contractile injection system tape measure protein [Cellvibrio sp.]
MHPEHRIDEFTLDLSFTTTRLARREKAGLVSWISEDLLPALDTLFSYYSPGNQVLRFETLEFDLGKLDARHYQQQIREQLLEQFTRLLKSQMLALDPRALIDTPLVPLVPDTRAALQQLITYLSTGNITAHYAFNPADRYGDEKGKQQSQEKIHQQLFEQVIAQQDIAELLRQFPAPELLVARLVKQFSTAQRLVLLRQLAPQQLPQVQALLDLLEFIGQQQGIFQTATDQSNEILTTYASAAASLTAAQVFASKQTVLQQQLWQQVLLLALESPHASETIWLARLLEKLSNSLAIDKMQLHEFLLAIPLPLAQAHPLKQLQTRIAQLIQPVNPHTGTQPHNTADTSNLIGDNTDSYVATGKPLKYSLFLRKQEPLDQRSSFRPLIFMDTRVRGYDKKFIFQKFPSNAGVYAKQNSTAYLPAGSSPVELLPKDITNIPRALLQQKVAQALVRADIRLLQTIWPTLVAREPELLFAALQHYLPQAEIRQQLMMQLPLSIQADIIGILAADIKPLFLRLQQMADELVNAMSAQAGNKNNFAFIDSALTNGAEKINSESPTHLQRRLWEIAVGLLLNHSPATVSSPNTKNPDIFLHQLIEHYAHIGSLNAQWLQQLWRQVIQLSASMSTGMIFSSASTTEKLVTVQAEATQSFSTHSTIESATTSPKAESMLFEASINELSSIEPLAVASFDNDSLISEPNIIQQQFVVQQTSEVHSGNQQTISAASPTNLSATPQPENPLQRTASQQPNLDNISDHQLFDLCLRLKSGAVSWSQISFGVALLQRMIDSYIRLGHSATAENCRDFIAAIDNQAAAMPAATEFYRAMLQALVADKLVDLEAIASVVAKSPQAINAGKTDPAQTPAANTTIATGVVRADNSDVQFQWADNQVSATESADSGVKLRASKSTEETAAPNPAVTNNAHLLPSEKKEFIPANITAIAESLGADTQPHKQLQQLRLSAAQWQQLCATVIQRNTTIEIDAAADLLQAIHNFSNRTIYFDLYYRRVINALLQQQPLDLELFAKTESDSAQNSSLTLTASTSNSSTTTDLPITTSPIATVANADGFASQHSIDGGDRDLQNAQSQIDTNRTVRLSTKEQDALLETQYVKTPPSKIKTPVQSLLAAAQPRDYLQQL